MAYDNEDVLRKWRLILGGQQNDEKGHSLEQVDLQMDRTLEALYDDGKQGGLIPSSPNVSR